MNRWFVPAVLALLVLRGPPAPGRDATRGPRAKAAATHKKIDMNLLRDELNLTAQQEAQVEQLYRTYLQATRNWTSEKGQEYRDLSERYKTATKSGDREAAAKARDQLAKVTRARTEIVETFINQLADVLTKEQAVRAERIFLPYRRPSSSGATAQVIREVTALRGVGLTPRQQDKIHQLLQSAMDAIKKDVLTDSQRKHLSELVAAGPPASSDQLVGLSGALKNLDLSEEQVRKIKALQLEAKRADPSRSRKDVLRTLQRRIFDEILTDAQRDAVRIRKPAKSAKSTKPIKKPRKTHKDR